MIATGDLDTSTAPPDTVPRQYLASATGNLLAFRATLAPDLEWTTDVLFKRPIDGFSCAGKDNGIDQVEYETRKGGWFGGRAGRLASYGSPTCLEPILQTLVAALNLAMVFVIKHTQAKLSFATQRKLDEILRRSRVPTMR